MCAAELGAGRQPGTGRSAGARLWVFSEGLRLQIPEALSGCFYSQNESPNGIRDAPWSPQAKITSRPQGPVGGAGAPSQRRGRCGPGECLSRFLQEGHMLWTPAGQLLDPSSPLTICATLDPSEPASKPQFPYVKNGCSSGSVVGLRRGGNAMACGGACPVAPSSKNVGEAPFHFPPSCPHGGQSAPRRGCRELGFPALEALNLEQELADGE